MSKRHEQRQGRKAEREKKNRSMAERNFEPTGKSKYAKKAKRGPEKNPNSPFSERG